MGYLDKRLVPVDRVTLVARVDLLAAAFWQAHVLEVDELTHALVQGEPMHIEDSAVLCMVNVSQMVEVN